MPESSTTGTVAVPSWAACLKGRCGCAPGTGCAVERDMGTRPWPTPNPTCTVCEPYPGDPCVCGTVQFEEEFSDAF